MTKSGVSAQNPPRRVNERYRDLSTVTSFHFGFDADSFGSAVMKAAAESSILEEEYNSPHADTPLKKDVW
jgi:hypothetical protein